MTSSESAPAPDPTAPLVGQSPAIQALRTQIRHLAPFDTLGNAAAPTVLLQGETGTGKGLVAQVLHASGPRAHGPFVAVNCAAIPDTLLEAELFGFEAGAFSEARRAKLGLFETASGGSLFLDEIDALPGRLQGKLLTVLETKRMRRLGAVVERAVDVKLIAATQAVLSEAVAAGQFRADLYHRLAVVVLDLPPLRVRPEDILELAQTFVQRYAAAHGLRPKRLSPAAAAWLRDYDWPGNVRELSHLMERVTLLSAAPILDVATLERLVLPRVGPAALTEAGPLQRVSEPLDEAECIRQTLEATGGNVVQAARLLGMSRSALRYRLQRYGLGRSGRRHVSAPRAARDVVATPRHTDGQDEAPSVNAPVPAPSWEQALVEKLQGFGGVLVQHTTSLFLVVFGMPRALEQMPQRAVQAALAIRHLALEARTAPGREPSLEVRQVVHLGPLLVERGTSEPSTRFLAVGETLSLPFRLLGHAAPGEMLVSAPVAPLVAGMCELQARAVSLGTGGGVQGDVYSVLGLVSRHSPLAGLGARSLSRFVGREQELTTLRALLAQVEEGQGQVVGIVGEPGVGKSRLLDEFRRSLAGQRVTYLEGRCLSYGSPMPYGPVLDLLRNHCGIIATESPEAITEKVRVSLGEVGMDPAQGVPYLLHLLGVVAEKEELAVLSPEILKARTCATLRQLTLRGSQEQSLILAVEDLQWIDQTSEDLLASLVESLASTSILLLVTYRPGYHPPWLGKSYATQRVLPPLTPRDSLHVVQAVLQTEQVPASLVQLILAKAEGNPFFLEELVQGLVEQGVLVRTSGSGVTLAEPYRTRPLTEMQLPPTVQGVLAARIDRLEAKAKALLHTLAVIGKAFSWSLLTRIVEQPEAELRLLLAHLQAAEFLYECPAFPEPEYTFKHALTQEMAYSTLPRARRWAVHEHTAQAIEGLFSHRLEEHYSELAHHYSHSRNIPQAVDYLQRAGRQAVQQSAPVEAISHLTQGLELLTSLPDTPRAHPAGTRPARGARASADGHPGLCSPGGRTHLCAGVVRPG